MLNLIEQSEHGMELKDFCEELRVAAIQFNGRSGSVLLSNLFDGSDQILSCPPDSLTGGMVLYNLRHIAVNYPLKEWPNKITTFQPKLIRHDEEINKEVGVPLDVFKETLLEMLHKTLTGTDMDLHSLVGLLFKLIHISYAIAKGEDLSNKKLVIWQQHMPLDEIRAKDTVKFLKKLTIITCVRHPIITLDSHFWHTISEQGHELSTDQIGMLANSYSLSLAQCNFENRIKHIAVKFEDMHCNTIEVMKSLCNELCIDYSENMLETTLDKKQYYFKGARGIVTGTNPNIKQSKKLKCFTDIDVLLLKKMLERVAEYYNYDMDDVVDSGKSNHILYGTDESLRMANEGFLKAGRLVSYPNLIKL